VADAAIFDLLRPGSDFETVSHRCDQQNRHQTAVVRITENCQNETEQWAAANEGIASAIVPIERMKKVMLLHTNSSNYNIFSQTDDISATTVAFHLEYCRIDTHQKKTG